MRSARPGEHVFDRRIIGKAEFGSKDANPRFAVTTLWQESPQEVYDWCSERGQAEHHIKDLKRGINADRLSCSSIFANVFRLLLNAAAYRLLFEVHTAASRHNDEVGRMEFANHYIRLLNSGGAGRPERAACAGAAAGRIWPGRPVCAIAARAGGAVGVTAGTQLDTVQLGPRARVDG